MSLEPPAEPNVNKSPAEPNARVGNRRVLLQTTVLIPEGEDAAILLQDEAWSVTIRIVVFPEAKNPDGKATIEWKAEGEDKLVIEYRGMPPIHGSTGGPHQLFTAGKENSQRVFFSSSHFRVGPMSTVHLQFVMEQI